MNHLSQNITIEDLYAILAENGFDSINEVIRLLLNHAMHLERSHHLGVAPS